MVRGFDLGGKTRLSCDGEVTSARDLQVSGQISGGVEGGADTEPLSTESRCRLLGKTGSSGGSRSKRLAASSSST